MNIAAIIMAPLTALLALGAGASSPGTEPKLPVIGGKRALAAVNGAPITLGAFLEALASVHEHAEPGDSPRPKQDPSVLLDRLITTRLIAQEARNIGLDESAEAKSAVAAFRDATLQRILLRRQAEKIRAAEPADIEARYRVEMGEARVQSVLVDTEALAREIATKVGQGADFGETVRGMVEAGKAKTSGPADAYVKLSEVLPAVASVIATMKSGQTSAPIALDKGFTLVKVIDFRVPEDAEARRKAERGALEAKRLLAMGRYTDGLEREYATVDRKLLDSLDFDAATPGFEGFKKDQRRLAQIRGGPPVTVADLARGLEKKFFHGAQQAAQQKRIDKMKPAVLHDILLARLAVQEALKLKIDRTDECRSAVDDYEESLLFGAFVEKIVRPDVRVTDEEVRAFYEEHADEYASPEMMRLESLAFDKRKDAEEVSQKLRGGADFQWMKQNAPGQLRGETHPELQEYGGLLYPAAKLPAGVRQSIAGAGAGDCRLFADPAGPFYVLHVREVVPPKRQELGAVRGQVSRRVADEKLKKVLDGWAAKLRAASEVRTFVTPASLAALVEREIARR